MRSIRLCVLSLALLSLLPAACGAPRIVTNPALLGPEPTPQPIPRAQDFPRGRFSALSEPNMTVLWIENDGRFRFYLDDALLDSGTFEVDGPQVLVDSVACAARGAKAAQYDWLYDVENGLAFQPVATDPCPERQQYLSDEFVPKYMFVFNALDAGVSGEGLG